MSSRKRGIDQADGDDGDGGNKRARNPEGQAVRVQEPMDGVERSNKAGASLVLHVRALPTFTTQEELLALLTPFGPVTNALITQHNHQAFVQMASLQAAENIVRHSASPPGFHLRGRQIFLQYSNRKEIVAPVSQQGGGGAAASGGMVPQHQQQQPMMMGGGGGGGQFTAPHGSESATPNSVVLLTVSNLRVPVTLDHIHAICKGSGGTVARIVTFMKKEQFKALVQFTDVQGAMQAKQALEGKDIFSVSNHNNAAHEMSESDERARV
jgi:polypyrimidine tract-binding protein 2